MEFFNLVLELKLDQEEKAALAAFLKQLQSQSGTGRYCRLMPPPHPSPDRKPRYSGPSTAGGGTHRK